MNERSFHFDYLPNVIFESIEKIFFSYKLIYPILFIIGFISGLKLSISAIFCLITLLFSLFSTLINRNSDAISLIIISLYLIVNYEIVNTPSFIRYLIYSSAIWIMVVNNRPFFIKKNLLLFLTLFFTVLLATFVSSFQSYIEYKTQPLIRDLFVLFLLLIFCLLPKINRINFKFLFILLSGVLFGEILYVLTNEYSVYFNYSSVKALILFIPYFLFLKERKFLAIFSLVLCLIAISNYGTRMILLSFIFFSILGLVIFLFRNGTTKSITAGIASIILSIFGIQFLLSYEYLQGLKAIAFLAEFYDPQNTSIYEIFKILDPVRYAEHQVFFSRSLLEILFGNGLGAGIVDTNGYLGFVNYFQSAFSQEEINSNIYFNLHDYWIDYGLRFGLISVLLILFYTAISPMLLGNTYTGIFNGVMLVCITYSGSGMLILALLLKYSGNKEIIAN